MACLALLVVLLSVAGPVFAQQPDPFCPSCSSWQQWQACSSQTCGVLGIRSRFRGCTFPTQSCPEFAQQPCSAPMTGECCPCTPWTPSGQCLGNYQEYRRNCLQSCAGTTQMYDLRPCGGGQGGWSQWTAWGPCSSTCIGGVQSRTRYCYSGSCAGPESESRNCNSFVPCPPQGGYWLQWGQFGSCSVSCGDGGVRTRTRQCSTGVSGHCQGESRQFTRCEYNPPCTVGGQWGPWSQYSACTRTCSGYRLRHRECSIQGTCTGDRHEVVPCNTHIPCQGGSCVCPVWGAYGPFGGCSSQTCGVAGTRTRVRQCAYPGITCSDTDSQPCFGSCVGGGGGGGGSDQICNDALCDTQWSPWSQCTSCGPGHLSETRRRCDHDIDCAVLLVRGCPCTG